MSMCMMIQGLVVIFSLLQGCQGHGRLWEPASRVTMWRRGYDNPAHHTDHGFNCGGLGVSKSVRFFGCQQERTNFNKLLTYNMSRWVTIDNNLFKLWPGWHGA